MWSFLLQLVDQIYAQVIEVSRKTVEFPEASGGLLSELAHLVSILYRPKSSQDKPDYNVLKYTSPLDGRNCRLTFAKIFMAQIITMVWSLTQPDILVCEVKWALGSITTNKASESDGIPAELFQILKDDAVKVLHSICQQIWKTHQWPQDWKRWVFVPIPKKGNVKQCSDYYTIAPISHASNPQNSPSQPSPVHELWTSRCSSWF